MNQRGAGQIGTLVRRLGAIGVLLALWTVGSDLTAQEIAAADPGESVILDGRTPPGDADSTGTWFAAPGRVALRTVSGRGVSRWLPNKESALVHDGFVRARLTPGVKDRASVLLRASVSPAGGLHGYAVTVDRKEVRLERWDDGDVQTVATAERSAALKKAEVIEVGAWLVGPQISVQVHDASTLAPIATLSATDGHHAQGRVGFLIRAKDSSDAVFHYLAVRPAGGTNGRFETPAGPDRVLTLWESDLARMPASIGRELQRIDYLESPPGTVSVRATSRTHEKIRRTAIPVLQATGDLAFRHIDADYRRAKARHFPRNESGRRVRSAGYSISDSYKDAEMVEAILEGYSWEYPDITRLVELGSSVQGRRILALKISDHPDQDEDEPSVLLNGAHHGCELLSIEFAMDAAETLLRGYRRDSAMRNYVNSLEIWVVPLVNPDGAQVFIEQSLRGGRKNGRDSDGDGVADVVDGVDLNRNYPFRWGDMGEVGSSSDARHVWYRGPRSGSEPETQAMMRLSESERFVASISYHTNGTLLLVPYTTDRARNPSPNEAWLIAEEMYPLLPVQPNRRKFRLARKMYTVDGVDQDWIRAASGTLAYLVEGAYETPAARDKRLATVESTRPTWMVLFDRVLAGPSLYGTVRDAGGNPVVAAISIDGVQLGEGELWPSRCRDGRFERPLAKPGKYTVRAHHDGVELARATVTVGAGQRKRVDLVAESGGAAGSCTNPELCSVDAVCSSGCVAIGPGRACRIGGACVEPGAASPQGGRCEPETSQVAWTP